MEKLLLLNKFSKSAFDAFHFLVWEVHVLLYVFFLAGYICFSVRPFGIARFGLSAAGARASDVLTASRQGR